MNEGRRVRAGAGPTAGAKLAGAAELAAGAKPAGGADSAAGAKLAGAAELAAGAKPAGGVELPAGSAPGGDPTTEALAPLRDRIDAIDHEIVALLNERAQIALEIGRVKQVTGRRAVRDAAREAQVLERVTSASAGLFPEPELVALYRKLIAATRRVQHAQKRESDRPGPRSRPSTEVP